MHLKHSNVNIETEMHCAIIYVFAYRKTSFHNKKSMRKTKLFSIRKSKYNDHVINKNN